MTQQEFMVRTGYTPSTDEEFWAIHDEYCNSPYNMDEFCKNWAHKNAEIQNSCSKEIRHRSGNGEGCFGVRRQKR